MTYRYGIARTESEKREAVSLIRKIFNHVGYLNGDQNDFEKYLLLDTSRIFSAFVNEKLFGTISVVPDLNQDLPMDILYGQELQPFRQQGKRLAEATQFAVDHGKVKEEDPTFNSLKQLSVNLPLFKLILDFAAFAKIDCICITVNPKHSKFYETIGFVQIGGLKYYALVNNAPALAYILDLAQFRNSKLPGMLKLLSEQPDLSLFT